MSLEPLLEPLLEMSLEPPLEPLLEPLLEPIETGDQDKAGATLQKMGALVLSSMVAGEAPFESALSSTKFSSQISSVASGDSVRLAVPRSELEAAYGIPATTLAVDMGSNSSTEVATTVIESNAFQFGNESTSFASNPVTLQLQLRDFVDNDIDIVIVYQNLQSMNYIAIDTTGESNTTVTTPCDNSASTTTQYCPGNVEVVHECNGTAGSLVTVCPARVASVPSCRTLASDEGGSICSVVNYTATTTTCKCRLSGTDIASRRRRLGATDGFESLQVVTIVESLVDDFTTTLAAPASEKELVAMLGKSLIVISMFGALWFVGFVMIFYFQSSNVMLKARVKPLQDIVESKQVKSLRDNNADNVRKSADALTDYVKMLMPPVYSTDVPLFSRIKAELMRSHKYCRIFVPVQSETDRQDQIMNSLYILTTETIFLFTIALCYDIESPADDGSCLELTSESTCLARKSATDSSLSYCVWNPDAVDACSFAEPTFSVLTTILVASVVGTVATCLEIPVTYLFELAASPTPENKKVKKFIKKSQRTLGAGRIEALSHSKPPPIGAAAEAERPPSPSVVVVGRKSDSAPVMFTRNSSFSLLSDRLLGARKVVVATLESGNLFTSSFAQRQAAAHQARWASRHDASLASPAGYEETCAFASDLGLQLETLMRTDFPACLDLLRTWHGLVLMDKDQFAACGKAWAEQQLHGLEWSAESTYYQLHYLHFRREAWVRDLLQEEIEHVRTIAGERSSELRFTGDAAVCLAVLHEFILDVLGRDTPSGKIFMRKATSDFKRLQVVSPLVKYGAAVLIGCVFLFCLFYAILKGYSRGVVWQQQFLMAAALQLVVEIFLFETMEVLWGHVIVPQLAVVEVNKACAEVISTINLCIEDTLDISASAAAARGLDSSDYLFVSKQLANAFPDAIGSKIVMRYTSSLPSRDLRLKMEKAVSEEQRRNPQQQVQAKDWSSWSAYIVSWLRYAASTTVLFVVLFASGMPAAGQNLVLSVVQPCLLGVLFYFVYLCTHQPLLYLFFIVMAGGFYLLYRYISRVSDSQKNIAIAPAQLPAPQPAPPVTEYGDDQNNAKHGSNSNSDAGGDLDSLEIKLREVVGFDVSSQEEPDWDAQASSSGDSSLGGARDCANLTPASLC